MSFTYAGPSVAATFVTGVLNEALRLGTAKAADATAEFDKARDAIGELPQPPLAGGITALSTAPQTIDTSTLQAALDSLDDKFNRRSNLLDGLVSEIDAFFNQFFPGVNEAVQLARTNLTTTLGGNNFSDGLAQARLQFFAKRDVIRRNREREEDMVFQEHAAKGFQMPSGQLIDALVVLHEKEMYALADAAIEADAAGLDKEAQALERILRLLVTNRTKAINAFSTYLARTAAARYDESITLLEAQLRNQQVLSEAMFEYAQAVNSVAAFDLKKIEGNFTVDQQYLGSLDRVIERQVKAMVDAIVAHAKNIGTQAASAYNNARASAALSGGEQV